MVGDYIVEVQVEKTQSSGCTSRSRLCPKGLKVFSSQQMDLIGHLQVAL